MGWPPRAAPSSARIPLSLSLSPIISGGAPAPRPPRGLAPLPPPPASPPPPMTASSPNQCSLMGHPCTPMPSYDTILSTWVPFTHVPFHHVTLSLSRGCHHCQHCWADCCDGSCQRGCCKGGIPAITDPGGKALGGMSFRSPSCCASCRKQTPTPPRPSAPPTPAQRLPPLCSQAPPRPPKALVTSLEWVALGSQESRAKPPSPAQPHNLLGQPTPYTPWLLEHLDQTQQRLLFQMTQTAGEGDRKSPQRVQKMRHVQRKGLEGLGGDDTGWTSWSETLKLNVPIHFGNHGRLVVPGKLLTLKLKLS